MKFEDITYENKKNLERKVEANSGTQWKKIIAVVVKPYQIEPIKPICMLLKQGGEYRSTLGNQVFREPFLTNTKIPNTLKDENRADFLIVDMGLPLTHTGTSAFLIPDTVLSELGFTLLTEYQRSGMPSGTCGNHLSISHFIPLFISMLSYTLHHTYTPTSSPSFISMLSYSLYNTVTK